MRSHSALPHIVQVDLVEAVEVDLPAAILRDFLVGARRSSQWVAEDEGRAGVEMMRITKILKAQYIRIDVLLGRSVMRVGQTYFRVPSL